MKSVRVWISKRKRGEASCEVIKYDKKMNDGKDLQNRFGHLQSRGRDFAEMVAQSMLVLHEYLCMKKLTFKYKPNKLFARFITFNDRLEDSLL